MFRIPVLLLVPILLTSCMVTEPPPVPPVPVLPSPPAAGDGTLAPVAPPGDTMDPDPGPPATLEDHPALVFTAKGHYFGAMEKNQKATHTAVFYNAGKKPLVIKKVKTHCGCAAALLSSSTVPPGGRGTLKITMSSGTLPGKRTKNVEVVTNDPVNPVARYPISCDVIADAALDPIVLVIRATRATGEVTAHFDVISLRPGFDLRLTGARTSHESLRAEIAPLPAGTKRIGYRVSLSFDEGFGTRDFHEKVTVYTNSPRDRELTIPVIGSVRQAVLVVPERLYFPRLRSGEAVTRSIFIFRGDKKPLTVLGVDDASGFFETELNRKTSSKWEVKATISGEAPERTVRGSLIIRTDAPDEPLVTIPFEIPGAEGR